MEEGDDGIGKFRKGFVVAVFDDFLFKKFPEPLNEIQIWRIGREIMEDDVQPLRFRLDAVGAIVAGVVQKDMNWFFMIRVFFPHFTEKHFHGLLVAVGFRNKGDGAAGGCIERSDDIDAAPAAIGPDLPGIASAFYLPLVLILIVMRLVNRIKKQNCFTAGQELMNDINDFSLLFFRRRVTGNQAGLLIRTREFFLRNLKRPLS